MIELLLFTITIMTSIIIIIVVTTIITITIHIAAVIIHNFETSRSVLNKATSNT